jgi:signal transduction histidine kinase
MFRSIRWRLVASYVLITLLTVSLVGALTLSLVRRDIRQQETNQITANAQAIASQALPLMRPMVRQAELAELAHTASFFANTQVRILDSQHHILADSGLGGDVDQFLWIEPAVRLRFEMDDALTPSGPVIMALPHGDSFVVRGFPDDQSSILRRLTPDAEITVVRRIGGPWGHRVVFSTLPFDELPTIPTVVADGFRESPAREETRRSKQVVSAPIGPSNRPLGFVELSSSPDFGSETLETTGRALLIAAVGATALATIIGLLVSRGLTAPLRSLSAAASQMSGDDLSARSLVHGKGEIGQLARQFNQMADRLETSFAELAAERDALRRFIADASHELRTPITALKTFNELLQGPAADQPSTRAEFLSESQAQLNRLERITHSLLDLSRLDAGLVHLDLADHPVGELIETATATFKNMAQEKGITLSVQEPIPQITLRCDRARFESALNNLLDNAVKFIPPGGCVEIGAEQVEETLRLWVQDDGPGINPDDVPHIFDRFYRGPDSPVEGSGLGLAIVQSVVRAHGGRVSVESQPNEGSRFVIELPSP